MDRVPLASNSLRSAGYDAESQTLEIEFRNGSVYRYSDVPAGVHAFLLRAPSKAGYLRRMIEGKYRYERVVANAPEQDLIAALTASLKEPHKAE